MAFRDIMNNYFYGKQGKADMTLADLPANRRELFFAVLKVRWSSLVGVNLLYLVIWIPAIAWTLFNLMALNGMQMAGDGAFTRSDYLGMVSTWLLVLFPLIAITGPWNAGVTYVLRNWARDQHSFILSDFWDAVKGNWKQALPISAFSGALPFLVSVGVQFYGGMVATSPIFTLPVALLVLVAVMWSLATMIMYDMLVTYDLRLRDVIRNSVLLTVGKLPWAVLIKLVTLIVPIVAFGLVQLIPGGVQYITLAVVLLYLLFMPAFNKLVTVSYANWLCETFLNTRIEGAQTNIGLRPENWDDTEYRPEDDE